MRGRAASERRRSRPPWCQSHGRHPAQPPAWGGHARCPKACDAVESARRIYATGRPVPGTVAQPTCARAGSSTRSTRRPCASTRAACTGPRPRSPGPDAYHPALLASVTDLAGTVMAVGRNGSLWTGGTRRLCATRGGPSATSSAMACASPDGARPDGGRRRRGDGAVGPAHPAGVPHVAALSGAHLAALILPPGLRHLYIARDADPIQLARAVPRPCAGAPRPGASW